MGHAAFQHRHQHKLANPYRYMHGYIGNLQYLFEFIVNHTCDNMIKANIFHSRLIVQVEAIPNGQPLPPNGVSIWTMIHHEDMLSGEGGMSHA